MIKAFLRFAVEKPIINHIFLLFILLLAVIAYHKIPKEIFPPSALDRIDIQGAYPGASADVLDKMAVEGLEDELKKLSSIDTIDTVIRNGAFTIKSDIKPGEDKLLVLSDVKDAISKIKRDLPADMNDPVARIEIHQFPLLLVAVSGDVPKKRLIDAAKKLKNRLSNLPGIGDIDVRGDTDEAVKILFDDDKLRAYGIPKRLFYQKVADLAAIYPAGTVQKRGAHLYISTQNGKKSAEALAETIVEIAGKKIRLKDVATVYYGLDDPTQISHFNGKENVSLNVNKTKQGNAIALSKEIKRIVQEEYKGKYPGIDFEVYTDTSVWIKNRLNLVSSNIFFGLILVFAALLLSVNARIAIVVALGIPTSFMVALIAAEIIGYSLNMLTLLGGLIALGMLVDEAIVVAENIYRHIEMGKSPKTAAIEGALEMFPAVMTATLTTVFAFLPLLIMSGKMGMFMRVLPVMITVLLLSSLFEAFYFLPLHAKELFSLRGGVKTQSTKGRFWQRWQRRYASFLAFLLHYKKRALAILVIAIVVATAGILRVTKFQLFPEFDAHQIYLTGKVDINNKLYDTEAYVTQIEKELLTMIDRNETASVTSVIGFRFNPNQTFDLGENLFHIFINLHEKAPENFYDRYIAPIFSLEYDDSDMIRERLAQRIAEELKHKLVEKLKKRRLNGKPLFQELELYVPQTGIVGHDIDIGIGAEESDKVPAALAKLKAALSKIEGVSDIFDNADEGERELKLRINDYGERLGFSEGYLVSVLRGAFLKAEYGKMFDKKGLVRIKIASLTKDKIDDLRRFSVETPDGTKRVPLGEIADFIYKKGYVKLYKEDGQRYYSVFATVDKRRITPSEVMARIAPLLQQFKKEGYKLIIKGEQKKNAQIRREMGEAALIALFLIFLALVWMFDALVLPLIILSTIPLSVLGALVGTKLMGLHLTLPGVMGLIGLAGVVVNDGIIMLDFIKGTHTIKETVNKAALRLRPIMLTSVTTLLGLSSLIFFASGQALIIQPMAVSLGYGLAWATILNLFYVPLMYAVVYRVRA